MAALFREVGAWSIEFERHLSCSRAICISSQRASQALRPEVEEVQVIEREFFGDILVVNVHDCGIIIRLALN